MSIHYVLVVDIRFRARRGLNLRSLISGWNDRLWARMITCPTISIARTQMIQSRGHDRVHDHERTHNKMSTYGNANPNSELGHRQSRAMFIALDYLSAADVLEFVSRAGISTTHSWTSLGHATSTECDV